jgi:hypothetical protein
LFWWQPTGGDGQMIISDLAGTGTSIFSGRLFLWQPTGWYYLRFGGNWHYNIFQQIVLEAAN